MAMSRLPNGLPAGLPRNFPEHKDWRISKGGVLNGVKHQEKCNMCWAVVTSEIVAAGHKLSHMEEPLLELSATELLDCCKPEARGCYTYSLHKALDWVRVNGLSEERDYPFRTHKCSCRAKSKEEIARAIKIKGYKDVNSQDEIELLKAVCVQPIGGAITVTKEFLELEGGIYEGSTNYIRSDTGKVETHAILVAGYGYDQKEEKAYWLIKNSWGRQWGINGYGRIARSSASLLSRTVHPLFD